MKLEDLIVRTTYIAEPDKAERKWYIVDAKNVSMDHLASAAASILRGKNKPTSTPYVDTDDYIIVTNAVQVKLTDKKASQKMYYRHSNYPGDLKQRTAGDFFAKEPEKSLETATRGMLPHNSFGHKQGLKLHVYADEDHKYAAQNPEVLDITNLI